MVKIQNSSYAKKVGLITLLLLVAIAGVASSQQTFDVTMTADNVYAIYLGDPVSATSLEGNATNLTAGDIWVPEVYNLVAPDISFVYIAAWSDDKVKQGLLADFDNLTLGGQVLSGDPIWEVTATGLNLGNFDPPPTLADLTAQIVLANAGSNPSGGWVTPTVSSADNAAGGIHGVTIAGIDGNARWMWYDSGNDTTSSNPPFTVPYVGFNHDEYLIFRIPVTAPEPATLAVLLIGGALALLTGRGRKKAQTRGDWL